MQDPAELRTAIRQVTAAYIAAGLDPKKSILFNQSQVSPPPNSPGSSIASPAWAELHDLTAQGKKAGEIASRPPSAYMPIPT
ncbi:hypothetical protein [Bradyrhizobium sp. RDI18]|uniref:hypothetical protein n=1 Tax=Bradyrhizobium sp. RDI18 TaxID=3367400 RepID=UPI0037221DF1